MNFLLLSGGLILLLFGGDVLVKGAVSISKRLNLPQLLVGMVIVGFGTSAPELVVSVQAVREGVSGIAVGNVIGSSIANILLILAVAGLVRPVVRPERVVFPDGLVLVAITGGVLALGLQPLIPAWQGGLLIALLAALILREYGVARKETRRLEAELPEFVAEVTAGEEWLDRAGFSTRAGVPQSVGRSLTQRGVKPLASASTSGAGSLPPREIAEIEEEIETEREIRLWVALTQCLLGLVGLIIGAELTVRGAVAIASDFGISETIIGLTIVAVGTSVPELASAVVASWRGHSALAYGNIFGSNIFNLLGILGAAAIAGPLSFPPDVVVMDGIPLLAATIAMLVTVASGHGLSRFEAALLLLAYIAYIGWRTGLVAFA